MTLALAARDPARQNRLLWFALAVSLALNLCFVAGALWINFHMPPPPPPRPEQQLERLAVELNLDAQQKLAFDRYAQNVQTGMQQMRAAVRPLFGKAWAELAKPDADPASVMALFDQAAQRRHEAMRDMIHNTVAFMAVLSPEQRAKFVEAARRHPRIWGPPAPPAR